MMNKTLFGVLLTAAALAGCTFLTTDKKHDEMAGYLKQQDFHPNQPAAIYQTNPDTAITARAFKVKEPWMTAPVEYLNGTGGIPIHQALRHTLKNTNLKVLYSDDVNPNNLIHVILSDDVESSLEAISYASGQSYTVTDGVVNWSQFITRMFKLPVINGNYSYSVGEEAENSNGTSGTNSGLSGGNVSQSGRASTEFSTLKSEEVDTYQEFANIAERLIDEKGSVMFTKSAGGVVVTTTLSRMKVIERQFAELTRSLLRQVGLEIQIIRVTTNNAAEGSINWRAIREQANGLLQFNGGAMTNTSTSVPISFSATQYGGKYDGSNLLISLLEKQGKVVVHNRPTLTTQTNRVAKLDLTRDVHFVSSTEVRQGYSSLGVSEPASSMQQSVVHDGIILYALANISEDDSIILMLSSSMFDLEKLVKKTSYNSEVESPTLLKNSIFNTIVANNGETIIIGGLQSETYKGDDENPAGLPFLKTKKAFDKQRTETIVLVTPVIIEPPRKY